MPGKWTEQAERDLIFAVLASHTGGDLKVKVAWDEVRDQMHAWGHTDFTKEAINQRWTKTIVKDFKDGKGGDTFGASTAAKDATGTPTSGRERKTATPKSASVAPVDNQEDDEENYDEGGENKAVATPTPKRRKPSVKKTPKAEPKAEPVPKKEEEQEKSIFGGGDGVKTETPDEA